MKLLNEKIILLIGVVSGCPKIFLGKKNKIQIEEIIALDEKLFEKYTNLVVYVNKINVLKTVSKEQKQKFINMVLELLKFRGKIIDFQIWIYYTLIYFQKHINI